MLEASPQSHEVHKGLTKGVRPFIGLVFGTVGASFLATTGVLIWEFRDADWLALASFYSHLFIFFPTFAIVALLAFYSPACVFTDMYIRFIPYGVHRYSVGFLVVVAASIWFGSVLSGSSERSIFEVSPHVLQRDRGEAGRMPVLQAVENVRRVSQNRIGLSDLARNCRPDTLKDPLPGTAPAKRYCFASTPLPPDILNVTEEHRTSDAQCCRAQQRLTEAVQTMHELPDGRSLTAKVHTALLPFKVFFGLMLIIISIMLLVRRRRLEAHYERWLNGIERGVLVGAAAMAVYPIMSHAFLQSIALLYFDRGPLGGYRSAAPMFSFLLGAWWLLLLVFFYGRSNDKVQSVARVGGIVGSALAVVKYDQIIDYFVRLFGSGAGLPNIVALCLAAFAAIMLVLTWTGREPKSADAGAPAKPT